MFVCRHVDWRLLNRRFLIGQKFAELDHRVLHPRLHLRDILFQFDTGLFGWEHGKCHLDFDLLVDSGPDPPCHSGARRSLPEFAHAMCHLDQCHDLDRICHPSERHPAFYDQSDCLLLYGCQYDFLSLGEATD